MRTIGALVASLLILTACGNQSEPASATFEDAGKAAAEAEAPVASANEAATSEKDRSEATAARGLSAFDESVAVLPKAYPGVDAEKFFALFNEKLSSAGKGEFETTAEFQKRTANPNAILFPLSIDDKYEFVMGYSMDYDADQTAYIVGWGSCQENIVEEKGRGHVFCAVGETTWESSSYLGSNSFGVTAVVEKRRGEIYSLALKKTHLTREVFGVPGFQFTDISYKCPVEREKAKSLAPFTIRLLFVGRIRNAELLDGPLRAEKPKVGDATPKDIFYANKGIPFALTDVWCFVHETGEVLNKTRLQ